LRENFGPAGNLELPIRFDFPGVRPEQNDSQEIPMTKEPNAERESWLVGRRKEIENFSLLPLLELIKQDSEVELQRIVGSTGNPSLLVVKATEEALKRLFEGYEDNDKVSYEKNSPLQLSGNSN
jgi:hypothetical protein